MSVRKSVSILCFMMGILFFSSVFAVEQNPATIKLTQLLNQFTTYQADFTQTTTDGQNQLLQQSRGRMMLMRPDRFRWETQSPVHQIVITNGKTLWVYDLDLKQATEQSLHSMPINPAKLLSGDINALIKQFDVESIPHQRLMVFQLIPKKPTQQFRSIALTFQGNQLVRIQIQTNVYQTNTFNFTHIQLNQALSPSLFQFHAPSDVTVLK